MRILNDMLNYKTKFAVKLNSFDIGDWDVCKYLFTFELVKWIMKSNP